MADPRLGNTGLLTVEQHANAAASQVLNTLRSNHFVKGLVHRELQSSYWACNSLSKFWQRKSRLLRE